MKGLSERSAGGEGFGANALRQAIKRAMLQTIPPRLFIGSGPPDSDGVCLTFDDGPHPEHTPVLLDRLEELRIVATFFVVGERAAKHPDLVRRMVDEGHSVGHHSYTHGAPERTSALELTAEIRRSMRLLEQITGEVPTLFRPPIGKLSPLKLAALWAHRQAVVLWSADPRDFLPDNADGVRRFFEENPPRGGEIVLLHDVQPNAVQVLPELVRESHGRGLRFTTADEWTMA